MKKLLCATVTAMGMLVVAATGASAFDFSRTNKLTVYMAKFLCGDGNYSIGANNNEGAGVLPGNYATAINIGNPNSQTINISKQIVFTESVSALPNDRVDQTPHGPANAVVTHTLPSGWAVEWDCHELVEAGLLDTIRDGGFIKGFLIIKVDAVNIYRALGATVTAVYTNSNKQQASGVDKQLVSVDIENVPGVETSGELPF